MKRYVYILPLLLTLALITMEKPVAGVRAQTGLPPARFDFEGAGVPEEIRPAVVEAVSNRPADILPGDYFVVGVFDRVEKWGFGSLAVWVDESSPDWNNSIWFIAHKGDRAGWQAALQGTETYSRLIRRSPDALVSPADKILFNRPPYPPSIMQTVALKFPWQESQRWMYVQAWHQNDALDFAPLRLIPEEEAWVLAASDGRVRRVCGAAGQDEAQVVVRVENGGYTTSYTHLSADSFRDQDVENRVVNQGRALGLLYYGAQGGGCYRKVTDKAPVAGLPDRASCRAAGYIFLRYKTHCGYGTGPHLHWGLPSQNVNVEGWTVGPDGLWSREGVTKGLWEMFTSTNKGLGDPPRPPSTPPATATPPGLPATSTPTPALTPPPDAPSDSNRFTLAFEGPATVAADEPFDVSVQARDVSERGLYGVQLKVDFDPGQALIANLQPHPAFFIFVRRNIDNVNGQVSFAATLQGEAPGLTGDVTLLTFTVTPVAAAGDIALSVTEAKAGDRTVTPFVIVTENYTASIESRPAAVLSGPAAVAGRDGSRRSGATVPLAETGRIPTTERPNHFRPAATAGNYKPGRAEAAGSRPAACRSAVSGALETGFRPLILSNSGWNDDSRIGTTGAVEMGLDYPFSPYRAPANIFCRR